MTTRLRVGIACNTVTRTLYIGEEDLSRLESIAEVSFAEFELDAPPWEAPPRDAAMETRLAEFAADLDVLVVCHGSPIVTRAVIARAPRLRVIGDLEGDRFANRIDMAAAREAGIMVLDTVHSSSWPVAEWALALILLGLRQQGRFRRIISGESMDQSDYRTNPPGRELTGRTVGLIGFGHIAWRLRELLRPFDTPVLATDPFAPRELADASGVDFATLDAVMSCGISVCLAPLTPQTRGLIGEAELALLPRDGVFVNVSRGLVVDQTALARRAADGDAWFGIDAHHPEPIPVDSPLRAMNNVFLSPHIGGLTVEAQPRFFTLMVDELERLRRGAEPRSQLTERTLVGRGASA